MAGRPPLPRDENGAVIRPEKAAVAPKTVVAPVTPFTDTPKFRAAVAEAAKEAVLAMARSSKGSDDDQTTKTLRELALAIGEISDQGTQRKRVAPEILIARKEAYDRAVVLLAEVRANQMKPEGERDAKFDPEYRVRAKINFAERVIEPWRAGADRVPRPVEIIWTGMPNDALVPINDIAKRIYTEYRAWVGMPELANGADTGPVWVTQGGLVIKGEAPTQRRSVEVAPIFGDAVSIKGVEERGPLVDNNDPSAPFVRVLGTVADPARQNVNQTMAR